ncbi:MAG: hypothetical protein ACRYE8_06590 [Janthinobacterium lividum]
MAKSITTSIRLELSLNKKLEKAAEYKLQQEAESKEANNKI